MAGVLENFILIGKLRGDHVGIHVFGKCEDEDVPEPGQWVNVGISCSIHHWSGEFPGRVRLEEVQAWLDQLEAMNNDAGDNAAFEAYENWVRINMFMDPRGSIECGVALASRSYPPTLLSSAVTITKEDLPTVIEQTKEVIYNFVE